MSRVAVIGNVSLDILFEVPRLPRDHEKLVADDMRIAGGGAPANVAHWLARLGHQVDVYSVTGTDPLSEAAVQSLQQSGIDTGGINRVAGVSPAISVILTGGRLKSMISSRRLRDPVLWAALVEGCDLSGYDHVHMLAALFPSLFAGGRRADLAGCTVSTDLNGSYDPELVAALDHVFSNADELAACTGRQDIDALVAAEIAWRPHHFVVTQAGARVSCYHDGRRCDVVPGPVAVVDRTGGGDAFGAGYLHAIWAGATEEQALRAGLRLAGAVIGALGARPEGAAIDDALAELRERWPA